MKIFRIIVPLIGLAASCFSAEQGKDGFLPLAEDLVPLDSEAGRALFARSEAGPFWRLIQFYGVQPNLATCGVASCTMVLNSLPIERPVSQTHGEFKLFTADNFFTPAVSEIAKRENVYKSGMSLTELGKVLATFPVEVSTVPAASVGVTVFRDEVKRCTQAQGQMMLVNYLRKSLGQESGGHISPVAAYAAEDDRVLVLDVSTYKYPWIWVKTEKLFTAMGTNGGANTSRGFVVVGAKK